MSTKKLSPAQQHIMDRMRDGWGLGKSQQGARMWLQRGGVGSGGATEDVAFSSVYVLYKRGLLTFHYAFPTSEYRLAESKEKP